VIIIKEFLIDGQRCYFFVLLMRGSIKDILFFDTSCEENCHQEQKYYKRE